MIQLNKGTEHQKFPLLKTDSKPKVLPDRPVILMKVTKHNKLRKNEYETPES